MIKTFIQHFSLTLNREDELSSLFKDYYDETNNFIRNIIYWNSRDQNIDDLVQETYLRAWKGFKKFDNQSSFKTWI
jgi:RNA polymerase sigma-70 factor (ECF subfamily)